MPKHVCSRSREQEQLVRAGMRGCHSKCWKLLVALFSNGRWQIQWRPQCSCTFIPSVIFMFSEITKGLSTISVVALGPHAYDNKNNAGKGDTHFTHHVWTSKHFAFLLFPHRYIFDYFAYEALNFFSLIVVDTQLSCTTLPGEHCCVSLKSCTLS